MSVDTQQFDTFVRENWDRRRAASAAKPPAPRDLFIMACGLAGETGEVMELLKKHVRDAPLDRDALLLELGDVLHYLTRIAAEFGFTLEEVMQANVSKLVARAEERGY